MQVSFQNSRFNFYIPVLRHILIFASYSAKLLWAICVSSGKTNNFVSDAYLERIYGNHNY